MSKKSILIIDSDNASLNYLARMLAEQGYSVQLAGLGKEGLIGAWRDRPDLIIFDPQLPDITPEEFLQKIRTNSRTLSTPILALSSDTSPARKLACINGGVNEYFVKSSDVVVVLSKAVAHLMGIEPVSVKKGGFLIVFLSAKGGTGTSSLCANYATTICHNKPEARMVVADLVLPIGSIASIVGYDGDLDLVSVADLPTSETTAEYFYEHLPDMELWKFQLVPGAMDPARANDLQVTRIPEIINTLKGAYDYVVVDLGRSLSRISLPIIYEADLLVLTVSADQSSVMLTKKVWAYLQTQGIDAQNVYTILNRAVGLEGLTKNEAEKFITLPIKTVIPYMGSDFTLANNLNQPIIVKYPTDTASIVLKDTANEMIGHVSKLRHK